MAERITEKVKSVPIKRKRIPKHAIIWGGTVKVRHGDTCRRPGESTAEYQHKRRAGG